MSHRVQLIEFIYSTLDQKTKCTSITNYILSYLDIVYVKTRKIYLGDSTKFIEIPTYNLKQSADKPENQYYLIDNHANVWYTTYNGTDTVSIYTNILGGRCVFQTSNLDTFENGLIHNGKAIYLDRHFGDDDKRSCLVYGDVKTTQCLEFNGTRLYVKNGKLFAINNLYKTLHGYDHKNNKMVQLKYTPYEPSFYQNVFDKSTITIKYNDPKHMDKTYQLAWGVGGSGMHVKFNILRESVLLVSADVGIGALNGGPATNITMYDKNIVCFNLERVTYSVIHIPDIFRQMLNSLP